MTDVLNPASIHETPRAADGRFFNDQAPAPVVLCFSADQLAKLAQASAAARAELGAMTEEQKHAYDRSLSAVVNSNANDDDIRRVADFQWLTEMSWRYNDALSVMRRLGTAVLPGAGNTVE